MEILEKAQELEREGVDIIHMEIGEPDFATPKVIREAACQALTEGKTRYTHSLGLLELREAIAEHYQAKYGVSIQPEQVVITEGTSPAMLLILAVLLNPGEEVILSNPCYACYPNFVHFADGQPKFLYVYEEDGFQYQPTEVRKALTSRTKAIFINSPSNPTGTLLSVQVMQEIADLASEDLLIISDEIYHGMVYEGKERSILEFTKHAVVINGFSKLYAMTGWRLGYLIAPLKLIRSIQKLQQNLFISANSFVQWAGIAALKKAQADVAQMLETYNQRRLFLIPRLKELGFKIAVEPTGAFYILANAKRFSGNSYELALTILKEAKVAVTPGIDFGDGAEGFIRFSYANSLEKLAEGCRRLESFLKRYH
jgi:aspartate/methionine/tyrosine aminotransferase